MLSNSCKYAIRALTYIAINGVEGRKIGIREISSELNIPYPFLGKILQSLVKSKLLSSAKGPNGGFMFERPAEEISIFDVVSIVDGEDVFNECLFGFKVCEAKDDKSTCPVHPHTGPVFDQLRDLYKSQTIAMLAHELAAGKKTMF